MSHVITFQGSLIHYVGKNDNYVAQSLENLISASIDPQGYLTLCFDNPGNNRADGCSFVYLTAKNCPGLVVELNKFLRKKRIKKTFNKLLAAEPFSPLESLMAKAEAIETLLEEKSMEHC